jgi:hypothetical protein
VTGTFQQGGVVGNALHILAHDRGAHAVMEDLGRDAAERSKAAM